MSLEIISATQLNERLAKGEHIQPIDTRNDDQFLAGHIPNAVNMHLIFTYLATSDSKGLDTMRSTFVDQFQNIGIDGSETIVVYEGGLITGFGQSCRGAFLSYWLGHNNIYILDGGFIAWEKSGNQIEKGPYKPRNKTAWNPSPHNNIMANAHDVVNVIQGKDKTVLLDVRDKIEWEGKSSSPYGIDFSPRKGRFPNAIWLEWYKLMGTSSDGIVVFREPHEIVEMLKELNITQDNKIIIYCFKGSRAANAFVNLKRAGFTHLSNYFASWYEWAKDPSLPIDSTVINA